MNFGGNLRFTLHWMYELHLENFKVKTLFFVTVEQLSTSILSSVNKNVCALLYITVLLADGR